MKPDEIAFLAALRRAGEVAQLRGLIPAEEPPAKIEGRSLSENDRRIFQLAVNSANGIDREEFQRACDLATQKASTRFFTIAGEAMRQVRESRAGAVSVTDAHRIAALAAKIDFERSKGRLPDTMEHSRLAAKIALRWFRNQNFATYQAGHKAWSKIRKSVKLDYLPLAVRGPKQK